MSRFTRNRAKARQEKAERYRKIDAFYDLSIKQLKRLLEFAPDETTRNSCSLCKHWEPGDWWQSGENGIEAPGRCKKALGMKCWNIRNACRKHFDKKKMTGFFYQGGGGTPVEEDIKNVMALTEQLINENTED